MTDRIDLDSRPNQTAYDGTKLTVVNSAELETARYFSSRWYLSCGGIGCRRFPFIPRFH
jgi:hypothetical protein